eukprot:319415-Hanusia_phi.AAC.1
MSSRNAGHGIARLNAQIRDSGALVQCMCNQRQQLAKLLCCAIKDSNWQNYCVVTITVNL